MKSIGALWAWPLVRDCRNARRTSEPGPLDQGTERVVDAVWRPHRPLVAGLSAVLHDQAPRRTTAAVDTANGVRRHHSGNIAGTELQRRLVTAAASRGASAGRLADRGLGFGPSLSSQAMFLASYSKLL